MTIQLTPTQQAILAHAHQHAEGKIAWFPENIKGGARQKVIDGLFKRALITHDGKDWFVAPEGYDVLGMKRPQIGVKHTSNFEAKLDAIIANAEASFKAPDKKPRTRDDSKQAQVIAMLKRAQGATVAQICEATGWQPHTVRGTFAGAFKKKLGLEINSTKEAGRERVYRIAS